MLWAEKANNAQSKLMVRQTAFDLSLSMSDIAIEGMLFGYYSSYAVRYFKLVKVGSCQEDLAVAWCLRLCRWPRRFRIGQSLRDVLAEEM